MQSSKQQLKMQTVILPMAIVIIAALMRLVPHAPNFTPIGAMALFGGCYLEKKYAFIFPIAALFLSDVFLGFYPGMVIVYLAFSFIVGLGLLLRRHKTLATIIGASLLASFFFFLITNLVFIPGHDLYAKSLLGQIQAYTMALPFFRNTILGDLLYTGLFFGGYAVTHRFFRVQKIRENYDKNLYQNRG